jgi:MFS family permease
LLGVNSSAMNVAFPSIERTFAGTARSTLAWGISGYSIAFAALLLFGGRAADRIGRFRVFRWGLLVLTVGSAATAASPVVPLFLTGRLLQAAGAAMIAPSSLSLVLPLFPLARKSTAVGAMAAMAYVGSALAPSFSALALAVSGWRAIFGFFTCVTALAYLVAPRLLPRDVPEPTTGRVDTWGSAAGGVGLLAMSFALAQGPRDGWSKPAVLTAVITAPALLWLFAHRSLRRPEPLVNLRIFRLRPVWSAVSAMSLLAVSGAGSWLTFPLLLVQKWGWSATHIGLALTPFPLAASFATVFGGRLAARVHRRTFIVVTSCFPAFGMAWLAFRIGNRPSYLDLCIGAMSFNAGFGFTVTPLNTAALLAIDDGALGQASAAFNTVRQLAAGFGVATVVGILGDATNIPIGRFRLVYLALAASSVLAALTVAVNALDLTRSRTPQDV